MLPEHEASLRAYAARAQRWGRSFLLAVLALTLASMGIAILGAAGVLTEEAVLIAIGAVVGLMGVMVIAFPFPTPETVRAFGVRRSITIARGAGLLTLAVGLGMALIGLAG